MKAFCRRFALVFAIWTVAAVCGGLAHYLINYLLGAPPPFWAVFRRPLTEQWIWAALTPLVFFVAHRFPLSRPRLARAIGVHIVAFLLLSLAHCALAGAVGAPLLAVPDDYSGSLLKLRFLEEFYSDIWMYWPLVCIQALLDSHARTREREKRAAELQALLAKSQLALLRAQIQPHFLFNTLHAVSALVRIDSRAAEDMIADLAEILRASFADVSTQETTLQRELDLVACYLRIQQRRFGDRLTVKYHIMPEAQRAAIPSLLLQSLVENAVIHGAAPLARSCTIEIRAERHGMRLELQVIDDGAGMKPGHSTGLGLANARRRLRELYGEEQGVTVSGAPGSGVIALVSIPFHDAPGVPAAEVFSRDNTDPDRGRRSARPAQPVVSVGS
jgi:two-component system, LytTR family, sensor kinase